MSQFLQNIVEHPKTSIAGLLIGIATIAGVLTQQGVTLGHAGTGTVVALIAGVATALLGLISKDPSSSSTASVSTTKLGVIMLCCILVMGTMVGCSGKQVAQNIVNWTPALESAVATINSTASLLDPVAAPIFTAATVRFKLVGDELIAQANAYLANPTASVLAKLQTTVVTFQQTVNVALLQAAGIKDATSQKHALDAINGVGVIVTAILGLVQSISSKAALARMSVDSPLKLAMVQRYIDRQRLQAVVSRYGMNADSALAYEQRAGF